MTRFQSRLRSLYNLWLKPCTVIVLSFTVMVMTANSTKDDSCRDSWKELLSLACNVTGIMFYEGRHSLKSLQLVRERDNKYDKNAIIVMASGKQLGYVQRSTAYYLAPVMDKYKDALVYVV